LKKISLHTILTFIALCFFSKIQSQVVDSTKQKNIFKFNKSISGDFTFLDVDVFGNLYVITKENQLIKINPNGDSIASYNNVKKNGNPTSVDVSNPFRILVYYKPYATVVILDQLLTFRGIIELKKLNYFDVKTIAASSDNNTWIFDAQNFIIKKINDQGSVLVESNDLRQVLDEMPEATVLIEHDKLLFLYDQNKGVFIFDIYGAYKNKWSFLKKCSFVGLVKNDIYGFQDNKLIISKFDKFLVTEYDLPDLISNYSIAKIFNEKLYLLKKDKIEIYDINR
jgi:hypothetical protein